MLELKVVKNSLFLNILEASLDLSNVALVDCTSKGLKLQAVDTEHIVMIVLFFPAEDFKHYRCDKSISMGIPINKLIGFIRCARKDHIITIKIGPPDKDGTLKLDLWLVDANSRRLLVPDSQDLDPNYLAFVHMPSKEFMPICMSLSNMGGEGHISVTDKFLMFFAWGECGWLDITYTEQKKKS